MIPLSRLLSRRSFFPALLALLPALAGPLAAGILTGPVINPGTGHSYYLLTQNTWTASEAEAVTLGGHLVTINDSSENDWVLNTFSRFGSSAKTLWIGLHDSATEGTFAWTSGQSAEFRNWATGEPSAGSAGEDYVHLYELDRGASAGKWNVTVDQTTESGVPLHGVVELPLVVANVRAAQRAGTNLVDIDYDVTGTTKPVLVKLEVSGDNGVTFTVPATSLTGAVGSQITPAANLRITWDGGADWAEHAVAQARFRITADDNPVPGFALIPAGQFQMGDQSSPLVGGSDELPAHTVQVSAFYMGKYEVTKEEWDAVRTWGLANGYTNLSAGNGSYASKGANHPVHSINWYDMVKWCNARSQKENLTPCYTVSGAIYKTGISDAVTCNWSANGYRLPTEAEWEKAARGGAVGKNFPWGTDTISHSQANYYSSTNFTYDVSPTRGYHPTYNNGVDPYSSPVGSFAPNGYGLYDMAGNMWERCWDWYGSYAAGSQTDPRGASSGSYRVLRGGSWGPYALGCRAAYRGIPYPGYANDYNGFRPARSSVP
ncbi:MAG: SUMF1/EgtB/PvdO family nonheme iron enzyme [Verrucomicrobia bacterium]|nr:SUMF1/EgtB/PvdO family nonheme iron enzyme [Verrucomicrobiota bacterium]